MRYLSVRREIEGALATVVELLREKGEREALQVITHAEIDLQENGHDNWNGGTELWTVYIQVPVAIFVSIEARRQHIADTITANLDLAVGRDRGFWVTAEISPARSPVPGQTLPDGRIGEGTRAAVLDELRARKTVWFGALDEIGFLSRIFDLASMPSFDSRHATAEGDIWQHCINNDDWSSDWIYSDRRFRLYAAEQTVFGLAPVSPDTQAVAILAAMNSRGERIFSPECGWLSL